MATLFKQLDAGAITCGLDDQSSRFLPESVIYEKITKESILANLPFLQRFLSQWSPWTTTPSLADRIHDQARKVFAVLALIAEEEKIETLIYNDNICDQDLPLFTSDLGDSILVSRTSEGIVVKEFRSFASWDERRVRDFLERQWLVLAPVLGAESKAIELDPNCPLPIEKSELRVRTRDVMVHQAWLHPSHRVWSDESAPQPSFAIKEVQGKAAFLREKSNLQKIEKLQHKHLIKLIASCEKSSLPCFIFPWADGGDLWDFWRREDNSPRTSAFVIWLLEQVFGLMDAIRVLHEGNIRHGDIKPQNILHFTDAVGGRGVLVLADLGVSKFHEHATLLRNVATDTMEVTVLYEAPEAETDRRRGLPRSRRYDMWSTGCMLLEFIVWLLYGFKAVEVFRGRRISSKDDPTTAPGNFFRQEKGQVRIHSKVKTAMQLLRKDLRCEDGTALAELLDMIEKKLLQIDPLKRAEAPELHDKLRGIVDKARGDPSHLWKGVDSSPDIPKFFVRRKSRQNSDTSVVSSGSSGSASSGSSGSASSGSSGWMQRTEENLDM